MVQAMEIMSKEQKNIFNQKSKLIVPDPQIHEKDLELLGKLNLVLNSFTIYNPATTIYNPATQAFIVNYS